MKKKMRSYKILLICVILLLVLLPGALVTGNLQTGPQNDGVFFIMPVWGLKLLKGAPEETQDMDFCGVKIYIYKEKINGMDAEMQYTFKKIAGGYRLFSVNGEIYVPESGDPVNAYEQIKEKVLRKYSRKPGYHLESTDEGGNAGTERRESFYTVNIIGSVALQDNVITVNLAYGL